MSQRTASEGQQITQEIDQNAITVMDRQTMRRGTDLHRMTLQPIHAVIPLQPTQMLHHRRLLKAPTSDLPLHRPAELPSSLQQNHHPQHQRLTGLAFPDPSRPLQYPRNPPPHPPLRRNQCRPLTASRAARHFQLPGSSRSHVVTPGAPGASV